MIHWTTAIVWIVVSFLAGFVFSGEMNIRNNEKRKTTP